MSKGLKTLNDFWGFRLKQEWIKKQLNKDTFIVIPNLVNIKDLKQEAIKWVKQIIKECSLYKKCEICKQKVSWIKYFFNIKESEIK